MGVFVCDLCRFSSRLVVCLCVCGDVACGEEGKERLEGVCEETKGTVDIIVGEL